MWQIRPQTRVGSTHRSPTATTFKVLHGDRSDRINRKEAHGRSQPPTELSDDARAVWDRLAPGLVAVGVITA
jgi:hypothetical protein